MTEPTKADDLAPDLVVTVRLIELCRPDQRNAASARWDNMHSPRHAEIVAKLLAKGK